MSTEADPSVVIEITSAQIREALAAVGRHALLADADAFHGFGPVDEVDQYVLDTAEDFLIKILPLLFRSVPEFELRLPENPT